jgi:hypothetical protein
MFEYLARDRRRLRRGTRAFAREVPVGDACVFIDHGFQWDGTSNVWLTRARASFVVQAGPRFELRPRTIWNRVLGMSSRRSAIDPYFDAFFAVRTRCPSETWEALTARARTLLAAAFDDARLVSDGRMVTLWREADFGREADAEAAIELVAEVVGWRSGVLDSLRRLPGAVYRPPTGSWSERTAPVVELSGSAPVSIEPTDLDGRPVMVARAACGRTVEPFAIDLAAPQPTATAITPALITAARGLGGDRLACDGHAISLHWGSLETRREQLLAGANLVRALAPAGSHGLYR